MANVKTISISGKIPFNVGENKEMIYILGQMNLPSFNVRISYQKITYKDNSFGGKTAFYDFEIEGNEAVQMKWIENLIKTIKDCGGEILSTFIMDMEERQVLIDE